MFDIVSDLHFDNGMRDSPRGIMARLDVGRFKSEGASVLIVAGDTAERRSDTWDLLNNVAAFYDRVIAVWGNHDQGETDEVSKNPNVVVLDDRPGNIFVEDGIAYIGGCPLDEAAEATIVQGFHWAQLDESVRRVVLVTHYVPSLRFSAIAGRDISNKAFSLLERLTVVRKPTLLVFGHVHLRLEGEIDGMRFVSNPRGYRGKLRDHSDWSGRFQFEV